MDDTEGPSPIAALIRDRPEAFDFADIYITTEETKRQLEALRKSPPAHMRKALGPPTEG